MPASSFTTRLLVLAASGLGVSCTLSNSQIQSCVERQECRDAFGLDWTCGEFGYCEPYAHHPRCQDVTPPDLLENSDRYSDAYVIGSLLDNEADRPEKQALSLIHI